MKKAWIVCSLLGVCTLWVVDATFAHHNREFRFLDGAQPVFTQDLSVRKKAPTHLEAYNLHIPFDEAWGIIDAELCKNRGWKLGDHSSDIQNFNYYHEATVSIVRGKVDAKAEFIPGTEDSDTYVEIRTKK